MAFDFENTELTELTPKIAVIGIGGAGCNAVNNMIAANLMGVDFIVANTDAQSLAASKADNRIQLGVQITQGLGAGAMPKVGAAAAEEALENIDTILDGCHMAFITAGMGGGTGTGAAPIIAKRAREKGILTVGVVTKPFHFEGGRRMKVAEAGLQEMADNVDTLIIIPNQNLFHLADEKTTFADAFRMADDVLHSGVRGVTDLMVMEGLINLDFADVRTVMNEMGKAMMGTGEASGEGRAIDAAAKAISNPLLEEASLRGARGVIINVTGGLDMTLYEVDEAVNMVREQVDPDALIVFGSAFNTEMEGSIRVSVVATGIDGTGVRMAPEPTRQAEPTRQPESVKQAEPIVETETVSEPVAETAPSPDMASPDMAGVADQDIPVEAPVDEDMDREAAGEAAGETADTVDTPNAPSEAMSDQEALEAKALAANKNGFVAETPKQPKATIMPLQGQRANVFQEAAYENTTTAEIQDPKASDPSKQASDTLKDKPATAPKPSLFTRVTSSLRSTTPANETSAPGPTPEVQPIECTDASTNKEPDTPVLGGVSAADRPAPTPQRSKEQLEIPSFLKRQDTQ